MKGTQVTGSTNTQQTAGQPNDLYGGAAQASQGQGQANYQTPPQPQGAPVGGQRQAGAGLLFRGGALNQGRDNNGRDLGELTKKMQDFYEKEKDNELVGWNVRVVPMARDAINTAQSGYSNKIAMILVIADRGDNRAAYHTLLLASDMAPAPATRGNDLYGSYGQDRVTAPRTPATLADDALATVIRQRVGQLMPQAEIFSADWSQVPTNFKIDDPYKVASIFMNAIRACACELETKTPGFKFSRLADVAADSSSLLVDSIHLNQDQANPPVEAFDAAGLPIRAEIVSDFRSEQQRQGGAQQDKTENTAGVMEIGRVLAYTSLNIDPVAGRRNRYVVGGNQGNSNDTQEYSGEITISGFDAGVLPDLGNVLLLISTMLPLFDQQKYGPQWLRSFLPAHLQLHGGPGRSNFRPRDLGATNFDYGAKIGDAVGPFPTHEASFGNDEFYRLVNFIMQPYPAFSIDVPVAGADTWFLRVFAEATEVDGARQAIINAMDAMTENRFSAIFNQTASRQIVLPRTERVLNGYYTDDQGRVRDLREIDMLYLLNAKGHEQPDIAKRWANTFGGSNDYQLAERLKLIEMVVHPTVTGISIHKTFHPDFLVAMDQSIAQSQFQPKIVIPDSDDRMTVRQSAGLAQAGALVANFHTTMFTSAPSYTGNTAGYRGMAHTRVY
jgi:hypothetical protein